MNRLNFIILPVIMVLITITLFVVIRTWQSTISAIRLQSETVAKIATENVKESLNAMSVRLEQQSSLIQRSLGKIIPLVLPADVDSEISIIEKRLSNESTWPKNSAEVQSLNIQLSDIVNSIPPWAQEELLPRLIPRRWEIDALWILMNPLEENDKALSTYGKAIEVLISQKPENSNETLNEKLKNRLIETEQKLKTEEKKSAFAFARLSIEGKESVDIALSLLAEYDDMESQKIKDKLRSISSEMTIQNETSSLLNSLHFYNEIEDNNLREYALRKVYQIVMELKLRIIFANISNPKIADDLAQIEQRVFENLATLGNEKQKRDSEKMREYQKWALNQIKSIKSFQYDAILDQVRSTLISFKDHKQPMDWDMLQLYPGLAGKIKETTNVELQGSKIDTDTQARIWSQVSPIGAKSGAGWTDKLWNKANESIAKNLLRHDDEIASYIVGQSMVKYLAPINQGLLDEAVAQLFRKVYHSFYDKLLESDQIAVVEGFATADKKFLE
jgi:hypothetical protein